MFKRTAEQLEGWPKRLEIAELGPVVVGRVQVLTRVTPKDKNDIMRVVNATGFHQQDVMRMFLMCGVRAFLAGAHTEVVVTTPYTEGIEKAVEEQIEIISEGAFGALHNFDPNLPPGAKKDD